MVSKRAVAGVSERIDSAISQIEQVINENPFAMSAMRLEEVLRRDLRQAKDDLLYIESVAE